MLIKANTIQGRKYIETHEIYLSYFTVKQACYLKAHAIELCLKALCCLFKATDEHTESFSSNHDLKPLIENLIQQKVLFNDQLIKYEKTIKLANLFLRWLGRYFRPRPKELTGAFIKDFLEEVEYIDQNKKVPVVMVRNKYIS